MTKTTTKATATAKESAPAAALIVLGYDENHKPRAARLSPSSWAISRTNIANVFKATSE
jgi:hypothetical protein